MIHWPIARRYTAYSQALAFMLSRMLIGLWPFLGGVRSPELCRSDPQQDLSPIFHSGMQRDKLDGVIQIVRLKHQDSS
jgi:hypothetical protein